MSERRERERERGHRSEEETLLDVTIQDTAYREREKKKKIQREYKAKGSKSPLESV